MQVNKRGCMYLEKNLCTKIGKLTCNNYKDSYFPKVFCCYASSNEGTYFIMDEKTCQNLKRCQGACDSPTYSMNTNLTDLIKRRD